MRTLTGILAASAIAVALPADAKTYSCHLSPPLALKRDGTTASLTAINFPQLTTETWNLTVEIKPGRKNELDKASVHWPSNPIQLAGEYPVLPTAEGAIAFTALSGGPCMFTAGACIAMVQIADQDPETAKISVLPTALWTDDTAHKSDPFVAVIDGTCTRKDS